METSGKTRFVVGLGNPGSRYARTRHNVGFMVVQELARRWSADGPRGAFDGQLYDARVELAGAQQRVMLLMPMTYMNRSGSAVGQLAKFYKAEPQDILVVSDDLALSTGRLRARANGSAGGQKGLDDVLSALGTQSVPRLRIGIGSPPGTMSAADYVLTAFSEDELAAIRLAVDKAALAVEDWLTNGITYVMDRYNRRESQAQDSDE